MVTQIACNQHIDDLIADTKKRTQRGSAEKSMVEQMGVEPTTYTMRTYRSSQLSYCPTKMVSNNIPFPGEKASAEPFFFEK